jgi:hypothetical protein
LAFIIDRIAILEGRLQTYGSQIDISGKTPKPYPLFEPDKLNERRASIGLEPIEIYLEYFKSYIKVK